MTVKKGLRSLGKVKGSVEKERKENMTTYKKHKVRNIRKKTPLFLGTHLVIDREYRIRSRIGKAEITEKGCEEDTNRVRKNLHYLNYKLTIKTKNEKV